MQKVHSIGPYKITIQYNQGDQNSWNNGSLSRFHLFMKDYEQIKKECKEQVEKKISTKSSSIHDPCCLEVGLYEGFTVERACTKCQLLSIIQNNPANIDKVDKIWKDLIYKLSPPKDY